jgi:hypothetical protein
MDEAIYAEITPELIHQVSVIFTNLGAEKSASDVMAEQLLKRAAQLSFERKISFVEATQALLKQVVQARSGETSP